MNIKAFEVVRDNVTAEDAARFYGLAIQRGKALCPFHNDNHPSMTFRKRRFRCWACGAHGDVVDYVKRLYGIDTVGALRRINDDFHLQLDLDHGDNSGAQERRRVIEAHRRFEQWRESLIVNLCEVHRIAHRALMEQRELTDAEIVAVKYMERAEYYAERLSYGSAEEQMQIYRDRGLIEHWTDQILSGTSTRSKTA